MNAQLFTRWIFTILVTCIVFLLCVVHGNTDNPTTDTEIGFEDIFGAPLKVDDILGTPRAVETSEQEDTEVTIEVPGKDEEVGEYILEVKPAPSRNQVIETAWDAILDRIRKGELKEARRLLSEFSATHQEEADAAYAMYLSAMLEPTPEKKMETLFRLIKRYPKSPWGDNARYSMGELLYARREYTRALDYLVEYTTKNPYGEHAMDARIRIGQCLLHQKEYDKAVALLKGMVLYMESAQQSPECYEALSQCYIETHRYADAARILDLIIKKFPDYAYIPRIYMNLALVAEMIGDTNAALQLYEKILTTYPESLQYDLALERMQDLRRPLFSLEEDVATTSPSQLSTAP